jgi:phage terminase large subunit
MADIQIPEIFDFLFNPDKRYLVAWGGRGSAKSISIARRLILAARSETTRILCTRQLQKSIKDSVHAMIKQEVIKMGMENEFDVQRDTIVCKKTSTDFIFAGLEHNITEIKSTYGVKYCWLEEAQNVNITSWKILRPTVREAKSQFLVSFNPDLETDAVYKMFIKNPRDNMIVKRVNWQDNPFFPDVLMEEMLEMKELDYEEYLHVWEGHTRKILEGAIFGKQMRAAVDGGRVRRVPIDPQLPVHTFWDLGRRDSTAIWFAQRVGGEYHFVDYHEASGMDMSYYLMVLQEKKYLYGTHHLPHDAKHKHLDARYTSEQQVRDYGETLVGKRQNEFDQINAGRAILINCYFDEEKCADGVSHLQRWRYEVDPDTKQYSDKPMHDEHSHASKAFIEAAFNLPTAGQSSLIPSPNLTMALDKQIIDSQFFVPEMTASTVWMGS